jgi:hypothetical protein
VTTAIEKQQVIGGMEQFEKPKPNGVSALDSVIERAAFDPNFDVAKLQALLDMKLKWEANEAMKAFEESFAAFKGEVIPLVKDKHNKQYDSKYISLSNLVNTVTPFLSKHGLTQRWDIDQSQGIKVTCVITRGTHSKSASMTCPPDTSGAKNPIQQIKSAITYAKACTFESVCGLASTDANVEDDGNGAEGLPEQTVTDYISYIRDSHTPTECQKHFGEARDKAKAIGDKAAGAAFQAAYDERRRRFAAESRGR